MPHLSAWSHGWDAAMIADSQEICRRNHLSIIWKWMRCLKRHILLKYSKSCLKRAFCKMCVTICGRSCPDEGAAAGYATEFGQNIPQSGACRLWEWFFRHILSRAKKYRYTSALLEVYRYFIHSLFSFIRHPQFFPRLCLKKAFCKMFVTICENDFSNRL